MCFVIVTVRLRYSQFRKAEVGLGLGWGCLVSPVRLTHTDTFELSLWGSLTVTLAKVCEAHSHFTLRVWGSLTFGLPLWGLLTVTQAVGWGALLHLHYHCEAHSRSYTTSVRLTHIYISTVRLTHIHITRVRLTHIYITSVRLTHTWLITVRLR